MFFFNTFTNLQSGRECHMREFFRGFVHALDRCIAEERELYNQVSDEEWEAIRPNRRERRDALLKHMKVYDQYMVYIL